MDYQIPLHFRAIPNDIQNEEMISIPLEDSTVDQSKASGDAEFRALQSAIVQISSVCSSEDWNGQQSSESTTNKSYEDQELSKRKSHSGLPSLSFPERQTSLSWPSSPRDKITAKHVPSLDSLYIYERCLSIQEEQMNSRSQSKLPFLLRIHSGHFHICLGLCSQTVLWKTLEENPLSFIRFPFKIPSHFTFGLWLLALLGFLVISGAYLLKCVFHFETVRMEYFDRVRVNYFFVPWIAGMLLRLGLPSNIAPDNVHPVVCCIFMVPIAVLELKIYGQWFTKGKRSLARVANPSTHLSVIGNFMIARIATKVEWKEIAFFFFTVGLIHYAVVFITLYQRLSTDITASRKICPVFFLFIAAPSSASVAWEAISGSFDTFSKMLLFLSLFLCSALIMRIDFFRDSMRRFSMISWACAYPITTTSVATLKYAESVKHPIARTLAYALSSISMVMILILALLTIVNMVVARDHLFPNDTVITICSETQRKVLVIPNDIHNEEMISINLGDSTVEQSKASGDAEFRALQSAIEPITSVRSSGDCNGQQLSESTTNKSYEDQKLSKGKSYPGLPRLSFAERQTSLSWPSSPRDKITAKHVPSLDSLYIYEHCLSIQEIAEEITLFATNSFRTFSHMPRPLQSNSSLENSAGESLVVYSFSFQNPQSLHAWAVVASLARVSCMLLRLGLPSNIAPENVHRVVCCIFMIPIAVLELKIYGQFVHQKKEISGSSCKPFLPFVRNRKFHDNPHRKKK
ncbi:S-type anion channel SLAH3 [Cryptomeria japonica]|uniref:S-type anion channel SLAH3 n=1 Tax=Cryptomeria japonica TaxID=3369 RepID=UPI0025ACF49C|nr:S-type anion channel SLAH3 [Cryptomeria japonica]